MKGNLLQSDDVMVPNTRVSNSRYQKFENFDVDGVLLDSDKTEAKSEEDDVDYDQVFSLLNSKLLLAKTIQVICFIFWTSSYSTESHHQMESDWEYKHNDSYQQYLT